MKQSFCLDNNGSTIEASDSISFFLVKIQKRIINPKNLHFEWILQFKFKTGFLRFMIQAFFFFFFFGKDSKIVHLTRGLPCKFTCLAIYLFLSYLFSILVEFKGSTREISF